MPIRVIMPQLGESVIEGTISKWLKHTGDQINEDEPLLEINTDKVDSEIPSPASGMLLEILVAEGTTVTAGTLLAWIGGSGETVPLEGSHHPFETASAEPIPPPQVRLTEAVIPLPTSVREQALGFISPVVAKIAAEQNIDLTHVKGTGLGGRITKKDVLAYIEGRLRQPSLAELTPPQMPVPAGPTPSTTALPPTPTTPLIPSPLPREVLSLTPVRRAIAEHMVMSKHTSPHVTTIMEADLSRVFFHRQAHKDTFSRDGVNLTFTAYFISAAVSALKAYPIVNSSWSEEGILIHRNINIGMATSLGVAGLIVPVIKNADGYSLLGLARTINDLANRARAKQLKPEEVKDGTLTITNHGISGSLFATPIINQPQCAILGVGAIQKRAVVITDSSGSDAIAIRPMVYLSLTFDHRILDGAIADYFLDKVVESLQTWT